MSTPEWHRQYADQIEALIKVKDETKALREAVRNLRAKSGPGAVKVTVEPGVGSIVRQLVSGLLFLRVRSDDGIYNWVNISPPEPVPFGVLGHVVIVHDGDPS